MLKMLNDKTEKKLIKKINKKKLESTRLTHQVHDLDHEIKIIIYIKKINYNKLWIIISNKSNVGGSYKRKNIN